MTDFKKTSDCTPFVPLENPTTLIPILFDRLPFSSNILNMIRSRSAFSAEMAFYTLHPEVNKNTWIVATFYREDHGLDISISAPKGPIEEGIQTAFATSNLVDWDSRYVFVALERRISAMILEISYNIKGNITNVHPCLLYYMSIENSLRLKTGDSDDPSIQITCLDPKLGLQFLVDTWKYSSRGSEFAIRKIIDRNPSAGVYINGYPICGIATIGSGLLSMLYTLKEHRKKGYAKICLQFAMKDSAIKGFIPCLTVETRNEPSKTFQENCGLKVAGDVDWICFRDSGF